MFYLHYTDCFFEGDYSQDPYCLDVCGSGRYFPIVDCKKGFIVERKKKIISSRCGPSCKCYLKCGQLSLFD